MFLIGNVLEPRAGIEPATCGLFGQSHVGGSQRLFFAHAEPNNVAGIGNEARTLLISLGPAPAAISLCRGQEKHTMRETEAQIEIPAQIIDGFCLLPLACS